MKPTNPPVFFLFLPAHIPIFLFPQPKTTYNRKSSTVRNVVLGWEFGENSPTLFSPQSNSKQIRVGFYPPNNHPLQYNSKRNQPHPFPRTADFGQPLSINSAQKCNLPIVLLKKYGAFPPVSTGVPAVVSTKSSFGFNLLVIVFNYW